MNFYNRPLTWIPENPMVCSDVKMGDGEIRRGAAELGLERVDVMTYRWRGGVKN